MYFTLKRTASFIEFPEVDSRVMEILVQYLPPVRTMRHGGSLICPSQPATGMRHICVVNTEPSSLSFGVLYELVRVSPLNGFFALLTTSAHISASRTTFTRINAPGCGPSTRYR